jgi:hypothetical protein
MPHGYAFKAGHVMLHMKTECSLFLSDQKKGKLLPAYIRSSALVLLHEVNLLKETLT